MFAKPLNPLRIFPLTLLAASIAAGPSMAQELVLEEVIVTAYKRESVLMETAAAISAFDSNAREELGINNALDLAAHTPSLTVAPSRVSIRGIGRPTVALGSDPGVGLYIDGVYTTETDIFNYYANFLDVDRVEVLRGPQGTLYGRNSIGGAINIISKQPTEEWTGEVIAEVGNYDYYVLQGLVSGPLTDKLSGLVALSQIEREGLQKNIVNGDRYDEEDSSFGTISLKHQTTDNWSTTLKLARRDSSPRKRQAYVAEPFQTEYLQEVFDVDTGVQLNFPGMFPGQYFANGNQGMTQENPALKDESKVAIDFAPRESNDRSTAFLTSVYDAGDYTIKYIGGYSDFSYEEEMDADGIDAADSGLDWSQLNLTIAPGLAIPVSLITGYELTPAFTTRPFSQDNETWSHELQLITDLQSPFNFIGGLYYYNSDEDQNFSFIEHNDELMATYALFASFINSPVSPDNYLFHGEASVETTSYAAYGQMTWDWTDTTIFTLGLRYSYDEKDGSDNTFVQFTGDIDNPTVYRTKKEDWDEPTWRLGVDHFLADDHFLYAFVASGYRSGGFNLMAPTTTTDVGTVDPEEIISYELGYKGALLDRRVHLSTAVYYYDYTDLQVLKDEIIEGVAVPVYENASEATAWGVESELTALLTEGLTLSGTFSYNKTEYDDYDSNDSNACSLGPLAEGRSQDPLCTAELDLSGNEFPLAPEYKLSANLMYDWQMLDLDWRAMLSYQYTGEQYMSAFNNEQYDAIDDWDRWDARVSVADPGLTWELTAFIKNINDDREISLRDRPSTISHLSNTTLTEPRVYGLRMAFNF